LCPNALAKGSHHLADGYDGRPAYGGTIRFEVLILPVSATDVVVVDRKRSR